MDKRKFIFLCSANKNKVSMDKEIEKLELHIMRLEQAIRQIQRLKEMGIPDEKINEKTDEYLDGILKTKQKIEELKKQK